MRRSAARSLIRRGLMLILGGSAMIAASRAASGSCRISTGKGFHDHVRLQIGLTGCVETEQDVGDGKGRWADDVNETSDQDRASLARGIISAGAQESASVHWLIGRHRQGLQCTPCSPHRAVSDAETGA